MLGEKNIQLESLGVGMKKIFFNGSILTMERSDADTEKKNAPEAVLVEKGIITRVGTLHEVQAAAGGKAEYHDLKGCCLMPAFIDAHSHFIMNAQMSLCADLSECRSFRDIAVTLAQYIKDNRITNKKAVLGFGYDHNFLKESRHPDKRVLDRVSRTIPILILHVSGHLACANSAALGLAGVTPSTPEPPGGRIGRLEDGREPSGYMEEAAVAHVQKAMAPRLKKSVGSLLKNMHTQYLRYGVTTVQEGAATASDFKLLRILSWLRLLKLDVVVYPLMTAGGIGLMKKYGDAYHGYRNHVKIGGYKLILDGSPQGRTAWMSEPYAGLGDYRGYEWLSDQDVEKYVRTAVNEGRQILVHCNGDAASEQFLNAYEKSLFLQKGHSDKGSSLRPVMVHCQTVRNDQLDRMAKLSMLASIFVGHVWYWGDVHIQNFGLERGSRISPVRDAMERGLVVNFHQDTPVTKPDMLHSVWCAVNRVSRKGTVIGEGQKIPIYDALKAVTVNAAYQYHEENRKGTIRRGKIADFVVLNKSPLDVDPMKIRNIKVLETIKDGKTVYSAK